MKPKAFVIMPFAPDFDEIYNLFIADALSEAGFEVFKADDMKSQQNILQDIVSAIINSNLIVADLTDSNPNVYYELGIAHALRKPVILLTQAIDDLPFDLRSYRVVSYDTHFAAIKSARGELILLAKGAVDRSVPFGNPVIDFIGSDNVPLFNALLTDIASLKKDEVTEGGELGFLDHLVELEEGFGEIAAIVTEVGKQTTVITEYTNAFTEQMGTASKSATSGTAKNVQEMERSFANKIDEYKAVVEKANVRYAHALNNIGNSLEYIVTAQDNVMSGSQEQLSGFLEALTVIEEGALKGRDSFSGMAEAMEKSPKIEKRLNRAIHGAAKEIRNFVTNVDQTIAIVSRARGIGERMLRKYNPIKEENKENSA